MIREELGNMEDEMRNSEQEGLEQGLGQEPRAENQDPSGPLPPSPLDGKRSAVSIGEAGDKEMKDQSSTKKFGSTSEKPEVLDDQHSVEDQCEVRIVVSPTKEERTEAAAPSTPDSLSVVSLQVGDEESFLDVNNSQVSPAGHANAPPSGPDEVFPTTVSSPGKKRSKASRLWKKNGGKKKHEKDAGGEFPAVGAMHNSRDAGTQTDQQELQRNAHESDPAADLHASQGMDQARATEGHEAEVKNRYKEQVLDEEDVQESESTSAVVGCEGDVVGEDRDDKVDPSFSSLKALRSFGRWADVSEDIDNRAPDTEPYRIGSQNISVDKSRDGQEQEHRQKTEQGFEGTLGQAHRGLGSSHSQDVRSSARISLSENEFRCKSQLRVDVAQREDIREGPRSNHEQELRGKSPRSPYGSPRSRHDLRADSWNSHKEQDLRGKTQLGRDSLSQASRELNWRRRPMEPRVRQDTPRSTSKLGLDGEPKKDEQQDFRSRSQYASEPQATHKNWIPRRGLQSRSEGEGRSEQSKARGKGKQGREAEAQNQFKQKFEADLKIKQEELLQKSKQSLKAEIHKQKRIEQARKGEDQLEMELNKNLVYEDGELFYLNI